MNTNYTFDIRYRIEYVVTEYSGYVWNPVYSHTDPYEALKEALAGEGKRTLWVTLKDGGGTIVFKKELCSVGSESQLFGRELDMIPTKNGYKEEK